MPPMRDWMLRLTTVATVAALAGSCGATAKRAAPPAGPRTAPAARDGVHRTHENLNATVWMQTAVEYEASALQAYRAAHAALDAALTDPSWTAATEQTGRVSSLPPAIVLDLDETVLDNSAFEARLIADDAPYSDAAFDDWCREEKAGAVPGAVAFLKYAKSRGVTPIYVTNRSAAVETATRHVLARLGIPVETATDVVLARHEQGWETSDKGARRAYVAQRYRILLLVGDNFEDFVSVRDKSMAGRDQLAAKYTEWWGAKWIVLPNPTYGSWEQAITLGAPPGDEAAAVARKYAALKLAR